MREDRQDASYRHCDEGSDLVDIGKHRDLCDHEGDADRVYWLVRFLCALPKE